MMLSIIETVEWFVEFYLSILLHPFYGGFLKRCIPPFCSAIFLPVVRDPACKFGRYSVRLRVFLTVDFFGANRDENL